MYFSNFAASDPGTEVFTHVNKLHSSRYIFTDAYRAFAMRTGCLESIAFGIMILTLVCISKAFLKASNFEGPVRFACLLKVSVNSFELVCDRFQR